WPRHGSTQQTQKCRPQANRFAPNPADDVGSLFDVAANHPSNERHRASHSQAKLATKKRWKCRFCRTILPFATETRLERLPVMLNHFSRVMAGLVPAIYVFLAEAQQERRGCPRQARA